MRLRISSPEHEDAEALDRLRDAWGCSADPAAPAERAASGEPVEERDVALAVALVAERRKVLAYCSRRLGVSHDDAEDIVADAIAAGWTHRVKLDASSNLGAWLCVTALNVWRGRKRRQRLRARHLRDVADVYRAHRGEFPWSR